MYSIAHSHEDFHTNWSYDVEDFALSVALLQIEEMLHQCDATPRIYVRNCLKRFVYLPCWNGSKTNKILRYHEGSKCFKLVGLSSTRRVFFATRLEPKSHPYDGIWLD